MTVGYRNRLAGRDLGPCDLRVIGADKRFGEFELGPVSLDVPRGSVVGLVGQNGAGKTTLMRAILGGLRLDGGTIELFGRDMASLPERELVAAKGRVAFVSSVCPYPQGMSVRQVMRMHELAYERFDRARLGEIARDMGLPPEQGRKKVKELSRGMGMKLQLCCALAAGVDMLVMDEPTAGLDPVVREEVLDVLRVWMEPGTRSTLISSHITSDLEHLADYLVMIDQGQVALACEKDDVSETMGVAQLRADELGHVLDAWAFGDDRPRVLDRGLYKSLLVPDRAAFREAFPGYACDRATIDDVMTFVVKGEVR